MKKRTVVSIGLILFIISGPLTLAGLLFEHIIFRYAKYCFFGLLGLLVLLILYRLYERLPSKVNTEVMARSSYLFSILIFVVFFASLDGWIPFPEEISNSIKYFFWTAAVVAFLSYIINRKEKNFIKFGSNMFQISLLLFLALLLINEFVETKVNLQYSLAIVLVLGVLSIIFPYEVKESKNDKIMQWIIAIAGGAFIFLKTDGLGWLRWITGIISGLLILLMSDMMYEKSNKQKEYS